MGRTSIQIKFWEHFEREMGALPCRSSGFSRKAVLFNGHEKHQRYLQLHMQNFLRPCLPKRSRNLSERYKSFEEDSVDVVERN